MRTINEFTRVGVSSFTSVISRRVHSTSRKSTAFCSADCNVCRLSATSVVSAFLLLLVLAKHNCKLFKDLFYQSVDLCDPLFTAFHSLLKPSVFLLPHSIVLLCQQIQKHRLIAADKVRKVAHLLQHDPFQHHISDEVNLAFSSAGFVVGTSPELLIAFQTFGSAEMQLGSAVGTVDESRKQTRSAGLGGSAAMFPKLLHPQSFFFGNNRFLHIGNDLMFLFRLVNSFMNFVADGGGFEVDRTARILTIFENSDNRFLIPCIRILKFLLCVWFSDGFIVGRGNQHLLFLKLPCNLRRPSPRKTERINPFYNLCGGFVNAPLFWVAFRLLVSERNGRRYPPPCSALDCHTARILFEVCAAYHSLKML